MLRKVTLTVALSLLTLLLVQSPSMSALILPVTDDMNRLKVHFDYAGYTDEGTPQRYWDAMFYSDALLEGTSIAAGITYTDFCVDMNGSMPAHTDEMVWLESTIGKGPVWNKVNWVLNNKLGAGTGSSSGHTVGSDAQLAIWAMLGQKSYGGGDQDVLDMMAYADDTYVPGPGNIVGVILHDGQGTMIEVQLPVPEPCTLLLLGIGLAGFAGYGKLRLRRNKRQ